MNELDMDFMDDAFADLAGSLGKELGDYDSDYAQEECLNKLLREATNKIKAAEKVVAQLTGHESIPCTGDPDSPPCFLVDADQVRLALKEYEASK